MKELFSLILIGIALSMDTFSLSLSIGTFLIGNKKALQLSLNVGLMHFIMPFLGTFLGTKVIKLLQIKCELVLGLILIIIAIQMIIDILKQEKEKFSLTSLGIFLFALSVSIDSFSLGLGLRAITNNIYLAMIIFSLCSFSFTYLGIIIGKYANKFLGIYANLIGALTLAIIGVTHLI